MYTPYILPRNHVHPVHIFIISPMLHTSMQFIWDAIIKIIAIIGFQTYSKHIPPRSYVSQYILLRNHVHPVHPFEELCIPITSFREAMYSKAYFHHLTYVTYKYAIYMRCHHKILIIYLKSYFMHTWFSIYQTINIIDSQNKNLNSQFCFLQKIGCLQL